MRDTTKTIAELNDRFRTSDDIEATRLGKKMITQGILALGPLAGLVIAAKVISFDRFTEDNDPHHEHDFGSFDCQGHRIFWKIDYYDRASFGTGDEMGSEDPADPAKTLRILTVMLAEEY
jgi:hypothetical protein